MFLFLYFYYSSLESSSLSEIVSTRTQTSLGCSNSGLQHYEIIS